MEQLQLQEVSIATHGAGGIVGYGVGVLIEDCINYGHITGVTKKGGIIGVAEKGNIDNSINKGICSSGIVDWIRFGENKITNCGNMGECSTSGLIGYVKGSNWDWEVKLVLENSFNLGNTYCGLIREQGTICALNTIEVNNCYNAGESEIGVLGKISTGSKTTTITNITNTYNDTTKSVKQGVILDGIYSIDGIKDNVEFLNTLNNNIIENTKWNTWKLRKDGYPGCLTIVE